VGSSSNKEKIFKDRVVAFHANSKQLHNLIKENHDTTFYVPNGVDCKLFNPDNKCKKKEGIKLIVGFVGNKLRQKGYNKFILPAVEKLPEYLLKSNIKSFRNAIPSDKMPIFYKDVDVYVVASNMDGTPNPALEAAATGIPIVSNRIGNMPEFIVDGSNGYLVNRNINEYMKQLRILSKFPEKRKAMGKEARKKALEWDWKNNSEYYRKMFKELI